LPWTDNSIGDGHAYTDAEWWTIYKNLFNRIGTNYGVMRGSRSEFAASGVSTPVVVQPGTCIVDGTFHDSDANENIVIPTPAALPRIDRIVARKDFVAQEVRLYLLQGVEGGPAPTPVHIAGNTWDLPLWQISTTVGGVVSFIADERLYAQFASEFAYPFITPGGRLTLTSGSPVTTTDVLAAATLYYAPWRHNRIPIYSSLAGWRVESFAELSLSLAGLAASTLYDVFAYLSPAGAIALEALAWASSGAGTSARATALTYQDGFRVKTGDPTRLYLGTFMTTTTIGQCEDSLSSRLVSNYYNKANRPLGASITGGSHLYSTNTWRARVANTTVGQGRVQVVIGVQEGCMVHLEDLGTILCASYTTDNPVGSVGLGLNSTSVDSSQTRTAHASGMASLAGGVQSNLAAIANLYPVEGYNYIQRLEIGGGAGTTSFYEDNSAANAARQKIALTGFLEG
jgi:hypothetical protein